MNYLEIIKRFALSFALLVPVTVSAVPAKPVLRTFTAADGTVLTYRLTGDERNHFLVTSDGLPVVESADGSAFFFAVPGPDGRLVATETRAVDAQFRAAGLTEALRSRVDAASAAAVPASRFARVPQNMLTTTFPSTGSPRALVVLVNFTNEKFSMADPNDYYTRLLNEEGFSEDGAIGSVRDYFSLCSMGQFTPKFDVYGPVTLKYSYSYYGQNDSNGDDRYPHEMAIEACEQLDDIIDFNDYDNDRDGVIDNIYVFYAGQGEADGGSRNTVWPHSYDLNELNIEKYFDGVQLNHYACSNERYGTTPEGIGMFCHEFSHVMGLPDLYTTSYNSAYTPGEWTLLDQGLYNGDGCVPPLYSAFERLSMGWLQPRVLGEPDDILLDRLSTNDACIIPTSLDNEFFLLENRQQEGFDQYLPGHGMLIWHIDYNEKKWADNVVNNTRTHQNVDIEEADDSQSDYKVSRASETFPGTKNRTSFTDNTAPSMRMWNNKGLEIPITEISETAEGLITFKVKGGKAAGIADAVAADATYNLVGRTLTSGAPLSVYNMAGMFVGRGTRLELPAPGLYILSLSDGSRRKIITH